MGRDNNPQPDLHQQDYQDNSGVRQPDQQHMQQLIGGPEPDFAPDLHMQRMMPGYGGRGVIHNTFEDLQN
jgi:hypothetical protein